MSLTIRTHLCIPSDPIEVRPGEVFDRADTIQHRTQACTRINEVLGNNIAVATPAKLHCFWSPPSCGSDAIHGTIDYTFTF